MSLRIKSSLLALTLLVTAACGHYSFTGVNITAQSLSIGDFLNNTDFGPANLGQTFTNNLKDYFTQNTSLSIVPDAGQLDLQGIITGYRVSQVAPTAAPTPNGLSSSALSRLTITVQATYVNTKDDAMSFKNKSFSFYADFSNDLVLADVEERLTKQIFDQIILDIFNASVANW